MLCSVHKISCNIRQECNTVGWLSFGQVILASVRVRVEKKTPKKRAIKLDLVFAQI